MALRRPRSVILPALVGLAVLFSTTVKAQDTADKACSYLRTE